MKRPTSVYLSMLALATLLVAPALLAQSASGGFHVVTGDGHRNIEFNAKTDSNGNASGDIRFTGTASIPDQDVDGDGSGDQSVTATDVSLRVDVDCLRVDGNRAAVAGLVKDSNIPGYLGRRVLLTVEDGGEGKNADPDRYTWGQYRSTARNWTASDGELEVDPGVGLTWIATDFEREDDPGVPSTLPTGVDCRTFPLGAYALEDLPLGSGNVQVKP